MIYYLKGKINLQGDDFVVLEVGGVGYKVFVAPKTKKRLSEKATLFCFTHYTEKGSRLYGFPKKDNLYFFEKLLGIPRIGPKTAMQIASIAPMEEIIDAIKREDKEIMREIFSIGEKKGQQIILELSNRFSKKPEKDEAFNALKELGFSSAEIKEALNKISPEENEEQRIKKALKILGKSD